MAKRNLIFTLEAWDDYTHWINQDRKTLKKINKLINDTLKNPFEGLRKPEPLKENYAGYWSRRIDDKNRLVYTVTDAAICVVGCRFHY
ncbi:Txe/YoeB family addiction module toxin [Candidatus Saccharibacteria bacterium]|jgi:toxin YoeB|nr:Txe/YoeB family addiction module toxin [Candidatus Saccharibacteria bacterium]